MKTIDEKRVFTPSDEQMEELRKELRERISREELNYSRRLEALEQVLRFSRVDSATFHRLWIRPLLAADLGFQVAIASVIDSYLQPN
jgi:hypothetical protein